MRAKSINLLDGQYESFSAGGTTVSNNRKKNRYRPFRVPLLCLINDPIAPIRALHMRYPQFSSRSWPTDHTHTLLSYLSRELINNTRNISHIGGGKKRLFHYKKGKKNSRSRTDNKDLQSIINTTYQYYIRKEKKKKKELHLFSNSLRICFEKVDSGVCVCVSI
jgi:hypothetical protein